MYINAERVLKQSKLTFKPETQANNRPEYILLIMLSTDKKANRCSVSTKSFLLLLLLCVISVLLSKLAEEFIIQTGAYHAGQEIFHSNDTAKFDNRTLVRDNWHQDSKNSTVSIKSQETKTLEPMRKDTSSRASKESQPVVSKLRKSWREVSILCVIHTCPQNLETRAKYVKETWAKLCNKTLYVSDSENSAFPTI